MSQLSDQVARKIIAKFSPANEADKQAQPIDMVLHCPACGLQHIDAPEPDVPGLFERWTNPPHRSHYCHGCDHVWRPADVPTNGVAQIKTQGKNDSPRLHRPLAFEPLRAHGVVDADNNLDCWDTPPFELARDHVAKLKGRDPAAMWRVEPLYIVKRWGRE